jgi:hypothetical protein
MGPALCTWIHVASRLHPFIVSDVTCPSYEEQQAYELRDNNESIIISKG